MTLPRRQLLVALSSLATATSMSQVRANTTEEERTRLHRRKFLEAASKQQREALQRTSDQMSQQGGLAPMLIASDLRPFGDWDYYFVINRPTRWEPNPGQKHEKVEVPVGFVTDLTSIPPLFWAKLRPEGRYAHAAVVHDYLYWTQCRSREQADAIFLTAMLDNEVDKTLAWGIHKVVRSSAGQAAWDKNASLKKAGERRVLDRFPDDRKISWAKWKQEKGVSAKEPECPQ